MSIRPKVTFNNVSKKYTLQQRKVDKLLELLSIKRNSKSFYALKNISFTVDEGETIGVIGINGSGKSTMSNILAQVIPPTSGDMDVNGETSLIAISVGLNNNLTGLENIELKCLMHGLKKEEIKNITPSIIEFADIGDFINQPVKTYSSGMRSRLGFAISAHTNPDIMIVDEALSVGDQTFYEKCIKKMNEFKKEGKTIFFISHSIAQIRSFCDKTMWLHYGELVEYGETKVVVANYNKFIKYFNGLSEEEKANYKKEKMSVRQIDEPFSTSKSRRSRTVKKTKPNNRLIMELSVLLFFFFISTFLMLFDNGVAKGMKLMENLDISKAESETIDDIESNKSGSSEKKSADEIIAMNQVGYIINEKETVFQSKKLENPVYTLDFSDQIYVEENINNAYKIKFGNESGYVNQENVFIPSATLPLQDIQLADYLEALPESFVRSYQYYLVFLNSSQEDIESKVRGKTGEDTDESGKKYLIFDKVKYRLNQDLVSDQIIISELDVENVDMDQLLDKATLKSKDNKVISVFTSTNELIFNLNNNTLTIKAVSQP
jgi:teichoic acid transport system ATP-binding protein